MMSRSSSRTLKIAPIFHLWILIVFGFASAQTEKAEPPAGANVAQFPKMVVGDNWTLDTPSGLENYEVILVNHDGSFVIEKKTEKDHSTLQLHYNENYQLVKMLDPEINQRHKINDPPSNYLDFPLYVGKTWKDKYFGWSLYSGWGLNKRWVPREIESLYFVAKFEIINTNVGKFKAYKINRKYTSGYGQYRSESYWYSPELKFVVKTERWDIEGDKLFSYKLATDEKKILAQSTVSKKSKHHQLDVKTDDKKDTDKIIMASKKKPDLVGLRWAVVIGISNYKDTRIPALRYASKDAQSFYNWLISPGGGRYAPSRIKLLIDDQATGNRIRKSLYEWLGQALAEDIVTIFFAGHGSPQSPDNSENLFLLPYDVEYDSVATTGFPMWDIETALKRFIKAKKVIVIADACHAGGVGKPFDVARRAGRGINVAPISSNLQNLSKIGDGICIISASDDNQLSQESQKWGGGHGVFTYYLLRGLKGEADYNKDTVVSLGEIIPYLSEQVRRTTRNAQTPTVAGRFDPALSIGK